MKNRQPLARALSSAPGWVGLPEALRDEVRAELNVEALTQLSDADELGRGRGQAQLPGAGAAVRQADATGGRRDPGGGRGGVCRGYRTGTASVSLDGSEVPIGGDEVVVSETPRSGWAVASAGSDTVALDLELSHELRLAGLLREIIRLVQDGRKNGGLEVSDRIELWWRIGGSPDPAEASRTHQDRFAAEVLATSVHRASRASRRGCRCPTPSSASRSGPARPEPAASTRNEIYGVIPGGWGCRGHG